MYASETLDGHTIFAQKSSDKPEVVELLVHQGTLPEISPEVVASFEMSFREARDLGRAIEAAAYEA